MKYTQKWPQFISWFQALKEARTSWCSRRHVCPLLIHPCVFRPLEEFSPDNKQWVSQSYSSALLILENRNTSICPSLQNQLNTWILYSHKKEYKGVWHIIIALQSCHNTLLSKEKQLTEHHQFNIWTQRDIWKNSDLNLTKIIFIEISVDFILL